MFDWRCVLMQMLGKYAFFSGRCCLFRENIGGNVYECVGKMRVDQSILKYFLYWQKKNFFFYRKYLFKLFVSLLQFYFSVWSLSILNLPTRGRTAIFLEREFSKFVWKMPYSCSPFRILFLLLCPKLLELLNFHIK